MNKLALPISFSNGIRLSGSAELNQFAKDNEGLKGIMEITVFEPESTELQRTYLKKVVIQALIRGSEKLGDRYSDRMMEEYVLRNCPGVEGKEIDELSKPEMSRLIDWCVQFGAENLGIVIK
jgi:hypothetical protein